MQQSLGEQSTAQRASGPETTESFPTQSIRMQVCYAGQEFPDRFERSIFLAGPTPRAEHVESWRPEALEMLRRFGYDGVIFVPESPGLVRPDYDSQVAWETNALRRSDVVLVWTPSDREDMPALCTRTEFGEHLLSQKMVFGCPAGAWKTSYLRKKAQEYGIPVHDGLCETVHAGIARTEQGALRLGAETVVPLDLWRSAMFSTWYAEFQAQGRVLSDIRQVHRSRYTAGVAMIEISYRTAGAPGVSDEVVLLRNP